MTQNAKCPTCNTELPASGLCPKCLFGIGLTTGRNASAAEDGATVRKPRHFAGYRLVRQIGCGGMGVVYEACEEKTNRTVALKMILDSQACSPVARHRFFIEAEAWARLDHPNIVPIYHVDEQDEQPFISMKFISHGTLREKIERGEIQLKNGQSMARAECLDRQKKIAHLLASVGRAVHHAHTQNVVHRDIKPGNILLDAEGNPHLTDFGLAKILDDQHLTVSNPDLIKGTVPYLPPELIQGEKVSFAADTYGLGVILYELLTGKLPFKGPTPIDTMRQITEQPPLKPRSFNKHIDKDLETICLKAMEKECASRYSSTADMAEDLDRWLADKPIIARPPNPYVHAKRWVKRNPLGTALIGSLAFGLLAAIFIVILVMENNKKDRLREADLRAHTDEVLTLRTSDMWNDHYRTNLVISAEELATIGISEFPDFARPTPDSLRLTFAVNIRDNPIEVARGFLPFIDRLQQTMSRHLGQPVSFNLKFCKNYFRFYEVASGSTDFQHMGAVAFWRAKELSPGVQAIMQDKMGKEAAIVVRKDSPITNLSQFANSSFAFSDTNATIGLWAKMMLAANGVGATNLARCETISDFVPINDTELVGAEGKTTTRNWETGQASGLEAANRVRKGEFDGAALQTKYLGRRMLLGTSLRSITNFNITPNLFAASAGLSTNVVAAFQRALLEMNQDKDLLGKTPLEMARYGFKSPDLPGLERVHSAMTNEALQFERPQPPKTTTAHILDVNADDE